MVKNTKGGNKAKKHARKSAYTESSTTTKTRLATDSDELYACCSKLLGNGMCLVMCIDGQERICIIRNKFRGRGKRGNILSRGTWCLVGRRDFEKPKEGKLEKTDLLEVYNELEKKNIIQKETSLKHKWKQFASLNSVIDNIEDDDEVVNFYRNVELPPDGEAEAEVDGDAEVDGEAEVDGDAEFNIVTDSNMTDSNTININDI